jgi:hypothetical protein
MNILKGMKLRIHAALAATLFLTGFVFAGDLSIRDVRNWYSYQMDITSIQCSTTVEGLIARSVMTMKLKDTLSNEYGSDSL